MLFNYYTIALILSGNSHQIIKALIIFISFIIYDIELIKVNLLLLGIG